MRRERDRKVLRFAFHVAAELEELSLGGKRQLSISSVYSSHRISTAVRGELIITLTPRRSCTGGVPRYVKLRLALPWYWWMYYKINLDSVVDRHLHRKRPE